MPHIQLLDAGVAELIAAGEVVERPSSVVKELTENAIDAGSTAITVAIEGGGIRSIQITDNGCGIVRDEVPTAFLRHATSKVRTAEDLASIGTLGFRGEALASVSAVSRVEMLTRTADELAGTRCLIDGSAVPTVEDTGCPVGTTVFVRDLFYNVPARMKFLKKEVSEANAVAAVVDCLAISHPEIAFRFIKEGREVLHTPGNGDLHDCLYAVFGKEFANNLVLVDYRLADVTVCGYVCKPFAARANRAMQHFFVNGRYVKTKTAAAALERAFQGNIMIGKFPTCVLYVELPPQAVDANVHPAKIEVRFANERPVFDAVFHAVKAALAAGDTPKQAVLESSAVSSVLPSAKSSVAAPSAIAAKPAATGFQKRPITGSTFSPPTPRPTVHSVSGTVFSPDIAVDEPVTPIVRLGNDTPPAPKPAPATPPPAKTQTEFTPPPAPRSPQIQPAAAPEQTVLEPSAPVSVIRYLGEVYRTYLLAEKDGSLYFVDKHAAHERILYNKLRRSVRCDAQMLLSPISVSVSAKEYDVLLAQRELLAEAGFEVEDFDGSLLVRSVPMLLAAEDVSALIQEIAAGLLEGKQAVQMDKLDWLYHSVACRAAIKAGDRQSPAELEALVKRVLTDEEVRYCPHGRPVCFELTRKELEKQFGRA